MSFELLAAFSAVSILFVITPGADWAYAMTAGISHRSPAPAIAGLVGGHVLATLLVAGGLATLISRSGVALAGLTIAGALYLLHLGVQTLRHPATVPTSAEPGPRSPVQQVATGFAVSGLNPKVFLLFLSLLPQFTTEQSSVPVAAQLLALGLVHCASCAVVYTGVSLGARRLLTARPTAARAVSRFSGTAMVLIAVVLLFEQLH